MKMGKFAIKSNYLGRAIKIHGFNPIWHGSGHFYPLLLYESDFVSWFSLKISKPLLEVKIDINRVILSPNSLMCYLTWQNEESVYQCAFMVTLSSSFEVYGELDNSYLWQ